MTHPAPHLKAQAEGRRLFIGGLNYETTDQSLQAYLSTRWPIEEVRVKRFPDGNSRGFGFATFTSVSTLEDCFNSAPHWVDGKQVEMRKVGVDGGAANGTTGGTKRSAPGHGPPKNSRVFIGPPASQKDRGEKGPYGLNDDISDDDLRSFFMHFGAVTEIRQHRWEDSGRKKGFGYIEFQDEEAADAACGVHKVLGVMLEVKPYSTSSARTGNSGGGQGGGSFAPSAKRSRGEPRDPEDEVMRKLFVGNMNVTSTKESVTEYFEQFGELENVYCPTGKGYAFMTFKHASGIDAVQRARPHKVDDRLVDTKRSTPKEFAGIPDMDCRSKKLYVCGARSYGQEATGGHSGLTDDVTDNDLETYFNQYGTCTSIDQKVWPDSGKKRGYGYIEFDDEDAVDKIVLVGIHIIGNCRLEARKGLSKEQQEAIRNGQMTSGPKGKLAQRAAETAAKNNPQYGYGNRNEGMGPSAMGPTANNWGGGYGEMNTNMNNMMNTMNNMVRDNGVPGRFADVKNESLSAESMGFQVPGRFAEVKPELKPSLSAVPMGFQIPGRFAEVKPEFKPSLSAVPMGFQGSGMQGMNQMQNMMQQMQSMQGGAGSGNAETMQQMQTMMMSMMKMQMQMMMGNAGGASGGANNMMGGGNMGGGNMGGGSMGGGGGGGHGGGRDYVAPPLPSEPYPKPSYGAGGGRGGGSYGGRY